MNQSLEGKLALVTGAGRGNGAAIARGLAQAGARIVVTDIHLAAAAATEAEIAASGQTARAMALDVTRQDDCDHLAQRIEREEGEIDILVNNAGILLRGPTIASDSRQRWRETMNVNLDGTFNVTTAFLPALKRRRGCIVNVASIQSFVAPPNSAAYSASKGALAQLTRALATELAVDGVRVNAIAPGIIATEMSAPTRADPERLRNFLTHVPMRRVGEADEIAGPVVFLCSAAASYITGVVLPVDGGYLAF